MSLTIEAETISGVLIVHVKGYVLPKERGQDDLFCQEVIGLLEPDQRKVILDLSSVSGISDVGMSGLVRTVLAVKQRGGEMKFCVPNEIQRKQFRDTRLYTVIAVYKDEQEALASFGAHSRRS